MSLKKSLKNKNYRQRVGERFANTKIRLKDCIWIHSVSVGETLSAEPLVKELIEKYPNERFVLTTTTPTGSDVITKLYGKYENVHHMYIPYDVQAFVNRFFAKLNPKMFIIIETEIWPNILNKCFENNIPVIIANARLSRGSFRNYMKIPFAGKNLFSRISNISAQTDKDARRYKELGVAPEKIDVTGNLKYSLIRPSDISEKMSKIIKNINKRPVWIAASTHDGEEKIILNAHKEILKTIPNCLLILVPRHKERFLSVEKRIVASQLSYKKRSVDMDNVDENTQVYLGDTMGELLYLYYLADIAFVGGTLISNGGHNFLEPAALKKPIVCGPSLYNFGDISKALKENDGLQVINNQQGLTKKVTSLLQDKKELERVSEAAYETFMTHSNVLEKQIKQISKYL